MVPTAALNDHVTPVLAVPVTVAANCWFCDAPSEAVVGVSETVTGLRLMVALADLEESALLVAFTVTFCALAIGAGAVYSPLFEMVPTAGVNDHVTPVLAVPVRVAVNSWVCEAVREAVEGARERLTRFRLSAPLADSVGEVEAGETDLSSVDPRTCLGIEVCPGAIPRNSKRATTSASRCLVRRSRSMRTTTPPPGSISNAGPFELYGFPASMAIVLSWRLIVLAASEMNDMHLERRALPG